MNAVRDFSLSVVRMDTIGKRIALSSLFAALIALGAHIKVPYSPVPFTLQVFFVLLCGATLGKNWSVAATGLYLALGAAGLPVFTSGALIGATSGFLFGFVVAATLVGFLHEHFHPRTLLQHLLCMAPGIAVIHLCGVLWLIFFLHTNLLTAFTVGSLPFLAVDAIKATAAAIAVKALRK